MPSLYDPEYPFTMSDAHRRPAHHFGLPAITWQQGFWKPRGLSETDWITNIEGFIRELFDEIAALPPEPGCPTPNPAKIRNFQCTPNIENPGYEHDGSRGPHHLLRNTWDRLAAGEWKLHGTPPSTAKHETVQIDFDWHTLPVTVRLEMFDEYFMFNSYISFWRNPRQDVKRYQSLFCENNADFIKLKAALNDICDLVERRYDAERQNPHRRQDRRQAIKQLIDKRYPALLYNDIWAKLSSEIFDKALPASEAVLGTVFSDFRGLILRYVGKTSCDARNAGRIFNQAPHLVRPCEQTRQSHSMGSAGYPFESTGRDALYWAEAILPLLLSQEPLEELYQNRADAIEYTFSVASQQRCLFGTGFGNQGRAVSSKGRNDPITYVVLSAHDDHRGIGRFVNRLHTLGGLRLASLRSLSAMRDCGDKLSGLRERLIGIDGSISGLEHQRDTDRRSNQAEYKPRPKEAAKQIFSRLFHKGSEVLQPSFRSVENSSDQEGQSRTPKFKQKSSVPGHGLHTREQDQRLLEITARLRNVRTQLAMLDDEVDGGITYRSLRSKHYRDRFSELVKAMEFSRLAGYQPYDQFVRHRLGRAFDLIEEVGSRYRQVFEMEVRARKLLMLYHSDDNQSSIRHITDVIGDLQFWGEVMLLYIILPHYTSELLGEIVSFDEQGVLSIKTFALSKHHITFTVWAFFIMFATTRYWRKISRAIKERRDELFENVGIIVATLAVAFFLSILLYRHA